jgi:hypothetical protein
VIRFDRVEAAETPQPALLRTAPARYSAIAGTWRTPYYAGMHRNLLLERSSISKAPFLEASAKNHDHQQVDLAALHVEAVRTLCQTVGAHHCGVSVLGLP